MKSTRKDFLLLNLQETINKYNFNEVNVIIVVEVVMINVMIIIIKLNNGTKQNENTVCQSHDFSFPFNLSGF